MGQDVERAHFDRRDFARFDRQLAHETGLLHALAETDALSGAGPVAGLELEAWLVDAAGRPAADNERFLAALACSEVVTELGRFNIELNVPPRPTAGDGLARLGEDLAALWDRCRATAQDLDLNLVAIGILPSLGHDDLSLANLSDRARYRALNEQVQRQRHGRPVQLALDGPHGEQWRSSHRDVMLEAAATSFQVHLQLPAADMVRAFNAAVLAAAPLVAASANSPLLFGRRLWMESRIPLFEQALGVGTRLDGRREALARVGFGDGYVGWSLLELFRENVDRFEPLLPLALPEPPERMPHLRLHNGTIWRWIRPLLGFDPDGTPHLRLEHRPLAAGPSLIDGMADLACTLGLVAGLARLPQPPEAALPFAQARANFYAAAREGLAATLHWPGQPPMTAQALWPLLLPIAADGLATLGVQRRLADDWLAIIEARVLSGRTGAAWQLAHLDRVGGDLAALTLAYADRQASGEPVHRWR